MKTNLIILVLVLLVFYGGKTYSQTTTSASMTLSCYGQSSIDDQNNALYYTCIVALISSKKWYIKDYNGNYLIDIAQLIDNRAYYIYSESGEYYDELSRESIYKIAKLTGDPEIQIDKVDKRTEITVEAEFVISDPDINGMLNNSECKMRSYIGLGSICYSWKMDYSNIDNAKDIGSFNNNGFYGSFGNFKVGSKFFAIEFILGDYERISHLKTSYEVIGKLDGPYSLNSSLTDSLGNFDLCFDRISVGKLSYQYDLDFNYYQWKKHFYPYNFIFSPFISVLPYEIMFIKLPFDYYKRSDNRISGIADAGKPTSIISWFKTFEAGIKIKSSLYILEAGYTWRYGDRSFTQNLETDSYGSISPSAQRKLDLRYSYFFLRLGINFNWMQGR
jgi:hypothetical protein